MLEQQVRRMLADPRSESLVTNFAAQWLFLRDIEAKQPDVLLFRDFDEALRKAFERETELFLDSILRENRSVLDLLTANYTFVNERLAKHYGIPNVEGSHFRRVTFPAGSPRGGLLGQGSILTLTSMPRGPRRCCAASGCLENLLASPPPPPPPNVPALKTEGSKPARRYRCARPWCSIAPIPPARAATRAWTRSASPWKTSTRSGSGAITMRQAHRCQEHARRMAPWFDGMAGVKQAHPAAIPISFAGAIAEKLLMYGDRPQHCSITITPAVREIVRDAAAEQLQVFVPCSGGGAEHSVSDENVEAGEEKSGEEEPMMFITKKSLPRRTFLKGLGATLALPLLDSMVPALSAQTPLAPRLGFVYVSHGVIFDQWKPTKIGAGFELTPILKPLEQVSGQFNILTGLVASASRHLGRRQRRSHPRLGRLADRRPCLRPHAAGRRGEARHHRGSTRRAGASARTTHMPSLELTRRYRVAGLVRFGRLLLRQHGFLAQ